MRSQAAIMPAVTEVMVRTYAGENQHHAAVLFAEDAPRVAADGWTPVGQVWVAGEWTTSAWIGATLLVIVGVGLVILAVLALYKPVRTLMVTYVREGDRGA
jgi:hypothetical protein